MTLLQARPGRSAPAPSAPRAGRMAVLDGLRISAALIVAVYHFTSQPTYSVPIWGVPSEVAFPGLSTVFKYGWLGVDLFFMISGFVILLSSWGRTPGQFARSRIVRLFPAYWPAVLLTAAVVTLWPYFRSAPDLDDILLNLTMLNGPAGVKHVDPVYWTLWAEARFYLLFAVVLLWRGLTLRRTILFGYGWLVAAVMSMTADVRLLGIVLQPGSAPFFVAGIALFLIHRFGPDIRLWGLLGLSFALAEHSVAERVADRDLNPLTGMALTAIFFVVLTAVALGVGSGIRWRWLTTAGALTYPFYLLHEYIGWTALRAGRDMAPRYVVFLVVLAGMLLLAWLLHRLVEKPLAAWLRQKLDDASTPAARQRRDTDAAGAGRS